MTAQPQMNGPSDGGKYIDTIDPDDPEYIRQMRRPAEVKEDVKQMEHRQRVSLILNSAAFREELEQIITDYENEHPHPTSMEAIRQIKELILPAGRFEQKNGITRAAVAGTIVPIADIRGVNSLNYSKGEKMLRCKVASSYRLLDLFGWTHGMNNHITTRISQEHEHFLTAPNGMMFHEVSASGLLKVDMQGETVDPGSTNLQLNADNFSIHAAIHAARPDIKAIIHLRTPSTVAVASMKQGLLPICHEAIVLGDVSMYDYEGPLNTQDAKDKLARTLGPNNKVLILRNHGVLVGGESIEEAFHNAHNLTAACDTQVQIMPVGLDNIIIPNEEVRKRAFEEANQPPPESQGEGKRKWRKGEIEFEALMRHLDNAGFRTGHLYHEPLVQRKDRRERVNADVEVPPSASSFTYFWDEDGKSPVKQQMDIHKKQFKSEWLNTPNAYIREEMEETGTPNPKKYTKWVPSGSDEPKNTPVRVDNPNQFAPLGADPKELRKKHKEIRKEYYEEKITAGPQSKILEGITWQEAQKIKDGHVSGTTDTMIVVGAASKGIIQRDHQHNAVVYKQYYAPNPFDNMSEDEVEKYKQDIANKARGGPHTETIETTTTTTISPGPDGKLISTEERMVQVRGGGEQSAHVTTTVETVEEKDEVAAQSDKEVAQQSEKEDEEEEEEGDEEEAHVEAPPPLEKPSDEVWEHAAGPPSPTTPQDFKRTASERYTPQRSAELVQELNQNFERSKSERKPKSKRVASMNGDDHPASPTKSTSSGGATDEVPPPGSPTKEKKKKKFRMPSFSKKKDKK